MEVYLCKYRCGNDFFFQSAVTFKEVKYKKEYLNDGDVFIIDLGLEIFQVKQFSIK